MARADCCLPQVDWESRVVTLSIRAANSGRVASGQSDSRSASLRFDLRTCMPL
jgi:hypothetical protein